MVNHGTKLTYFGKLIALLSSPDLEKNVSSVDSDEKMLWFDAAYLTPDGSIESIGTPGQERPPSEVSGLAGIFSYSAFVSAYLSSAEDSSPLFHCPL